MLQAIVKKGKVIGEEIPSPVVSKGMILIRVINSCISVGTEIGKMERSGKSLIKTALEQPENVKQVLDMVKSKGVSKTVAKVKGVVESGKQTGYSVSGVVVGVGEGITRFNIGDAVAASGADLANHAEYVNVPENLVMKIPTNLDFKSASTVTLGGIAMQGVRRADLRLGEYAVVVGVGILGILAVQMLRLSGIRVAAVDLNDRRLALAETSGADLVINSKNENMISQIENWTGGYGADAVIFTAATQSSEPLSQSFKVCKKKGRVILVGVSGMDVKRGDIYEKELDFMISTSYGPGRYDSNYEEKGIDYPYAYVRWTENRNMVEYLRLLSTGEIIIDQMIDKIYSINQVEEAFDYLKSPDKPLFVLLEYGEFHKDQLDQYLKHERKISINTKPVKRKVINIALVGAGNFATGTHLPNIQKLKDKYNLYVVVDHSGHKAKTVAEQYGAEVATTEIEEILTDKKIDLVLIATRHDSHGQLVLKALKKGKHVFVEKPLSTNEEELNQIEEFYSGDTNDKPVLMTGYNRRFSTYAREIKKHTANRINPMFIHYRMNAGYLPKDHWVHENGGRIVGEACHIVDLMTFLTGSAVKSVSYEQLAPQTDKFTPTDNVSMVLHYEDGSIASIEYFAVGNKKFPKEYMEVHFDEKTIIMDDYKSLKGYGVKVKEITSRTSNKGQLEELEELFFTLNGTKKEWPIDLWEMLQTTKITLSIL